MRHEQPLSPPVAAPVVPSLEPAAPDSDVTGLIGPLVVLLLDVVSPAVLVPASVATPPLLLLCVPLLLDSPCGMHPESSGGFIVRHSS